MPTEIVWHRRTGGANLKVRPEKRMVYFPRSRDLYSIWNISVSWNSIHPRSMEFARRRYSHVKTGKDEQLIDRKMR
jgi:hypothetical protein